MAKLSAAARRKLPKGSFAYPKQRRYPINDKGHAFAALRQAKRVDTFGSYSHVRKKVNAKFPSLRGKGPGSRTTKRRR